MVLSRTRSLIGVYGKLLQDAEEEELTLLRGVTRVQSRLLDGKIVDKQMEEEEEDEIERKQTVKVSHASSFVSDWHCVMLHLMPSVARSNDDSELDLLF